MIHRLAGLTFSEFSQLGREAFLLTRGEPKGSGIAGDLYKSYFRQGCTNPEAAGLSPVSQSIWESVVSERSPLRLEAVHGDEVVEGPAASKAIFVLEDGAKIETVLVPMDSADGGRGTLCLSSQAGCAMACAFCETGRTGLIRNLTAAEIVAQVHRARFELRWEFSRLVFMGMGEPLHNIDALIQALRVLIDPRGFAFGQDKITVCTVGLVEGIEKLAALGWKRMGLSLSLNAASQHLRERLMPAGVTNALPDLHRTLAAYPQRKNFVLALNYCLMPGINNTARDAQDVAVFAAGLGRTLVNLIPYNPGSHPVCSAPTEAEVDDFLALLRGNGLEAKVRGTKGRSIMAACGQLGGRKALHCS